MASSCPGAQPPFWPVTIVNGIRDGVTKPVLGQRFGKLCGLFKIKTKTLTWVHFCSIHRRGGWYGWFLGFLGHSKEGQNLGHTAPWPWLDRRREVLSQGHNLLTNQRGQGAFGHPRPLPEQKWLALLLLTRSLAGTNCEAGARGLCKDPGRAVP